MKHLKVKVIPAAKDNLVSKTKEDTFVVHTRQPRKDGRATEHATILLATHLGVAVTKLALVRGSTTPNKLFVVYD